MDEKSKPRLGLLLAGLLVGAFIFSFLSGPPLAYGQPSVGKEIRVDWGNSKALQEFYRKYEKSKNPLWWRDDQRIRAREQAFCVLHFIVKFGVVGRTVGFYVDSLGNSAVACLPAPPPLGPPMAAISKRVCGFEELDHLEFVRLEGLVMVCRLKGPESKKYST